MKKRISLLLIIFIIVVIVVLILVFNNKEVITICKSTDTQNSLGYSVENTYKIHSKKDIISKIIINQKINSTNNETLNKMKDKFETQYNNYKTRYDGYTYNIETNNNELIFNVEVDYNKVDLEKFIKDNDTMKKYVNKDNKFTLQGAKELYESSGAICK